MRKRITLVILFILLPATALAEKGPEKAYENALFYLKGGKFLDAVTWFQRMQWSASC